MYAPTVITLLLIPNPRALCTAVPQVRPRLVHEMTATAAEGDARGLVLRLRTQARPPSILRFLAHHAIPAVGLR